MNVLFPWFLAGGLLIAGPIIFHLIRRASRRRIEFSATEFLKESPPQLSRKKQIQNPWLLLIRCLIILALAFAFARPFLKTELNFDVASAPRDVTIIMDESASMLRSTLWDQATNRALELASELGPLDRLTVIAANEAAETIISGEEWLRINPADRTDTLKIALEPRSPSWSSAKMDGAIQMAIEEMNEYSDSGDISTKKEMIIVSDFSEGSRLSSLAGIDWPENMLATLSAVTPVSDENIGLEWLGWTESKAEAPAAKIAIRNASSMQGKSAKITVQSLANDQSDPVVTNVTLQDSDSQFVFLAVPENSNGPFQAILEGDQESFDNQLTFVYPEARKINLRFKGNDTSTRPTETAYFLQRASAALEDPITSFTNWGTSGSNRQEASEFFVVDAPLALDESNSLRREIESGAWALLLLGNGSIAPTAAAIANQPDWSLAYQEIEDARFGKIDFRHALFEPFSEAKYSNFAGIQFWSAHTLQVSASETTKIVASYDDGSPAIIEKRIGNGKLIIWGGSWSPKDSQWTRSTKFLPWFQNLIEQSIGGATRPDHTIVENAASLTRDSGAVWQSIDGSNSLTSPPSNIGVYRLQEANYQRLVALHAPPAESSTSILDIDAWEQIGVPLTSSPIAKLSSEQEEERKRRANAFELEGQQQLWKWLIVFTIVLLLLESLIAFSKGRKEEVAA